MVKKSDNNNFALFYALSVAIQLGFFIIIPIAISLFFGIWIDSFFQTKPIITLISVFVGMIFTIYEVRNILKPIINYKK